MSENNDVVKVSFTWLEIKRHTRTVAIPADVLRKAIGEQAAQASTKDLQEEKLGDFGPEEYLDAVDEHLGTDLEAELCKTEEDEMLEVTDDVTCEHTEGMFLCRESYHSGEQLEYPVQHASKALLVDSKEMADA